MRLLTNDPDLPELVLELMAMGKSPLQVLPGDELTVSLLAEEDPPQTVLLRVNYEPELKLTSIRCSAPYVHCKEVKPDVPEGDAPATCRAVEISVSPNAPSTPYDAVIAIGTTCKARPEVKLHVYGLSPSAVTAQPPRLGLRPDGEDTRTPLPSRGAHPRGRSVQGPRCEDERSANADHVALRPLRSILRAGGDIPCR